MMECKEGQSADKLEAALLSMGIPEDCLRDLYVKEAMCKAEEFFCLNTFSSKQLATLRGYMAEVIGYRIVYMDEGIDAAWKWQEEHENSLLWEKIGKAGLHDEVRKISRKVTEILS